MDTFTVKTSFKKSATIKLPANMTASIPEKRMAQSQILSRPYSSSSSPQFSNIFVKFWISNPALQLTGPKSQYFKQHVERKISLIFSVN